MPDIVLDNISATFAGTWSTGTSSTDKCGTDYRFRSSRGTGAVYAQFTPPLTAAGSYQVFEWHPQGQNRSTDAPHLIQHQGGSQTVRINQTINGGQWNLLGTYPFAFGSGGYVQITDAYTSGIAGQTATNVMADAIKFVYVPPPPSGPSIGTQPQNQIVNQGNTGAFSVVASGTGPLSYQWMHEGTNLAGATLSSYQKNNVQPADAGNYSVLITNSVNAILSSNATLTVNVAPSISAQPRNVTTNAGATVSFTVIASGTAPLEYQWQLEGSDISGATESVYSRNNVQVADNGAYSVIVSNVAGSIGSDDAILTVSASSPPPHIDSITLLSAGNAQLDMSGGPGKFAIEASALLTNWTELTIVTAAGNLFQYTDGETNLPARFYRLRVAP